MSLSRTRHRIEKKRRQKAPGEAIPALLGDGNGTVEVPGWPQWCYARVQGSDLPLIVSNTMTRYDDNLPVWLTGDRSAEMSQVAGVRNIAGIEWPAGSRVEAHGVTHGPKGVEGTIDAVYIHTNQIVPLLVYAGEGLTVIVNSGVYEIGGVVYMLETAVSVDMTAYMPTVDGEACYALLEIDTAGTITVTAGDSVLWIDLFLSEAPVGNASRISLALVKLIYGLYYLTDELITALHLAPRVGGSSVSEPAFYVDGALAAATGVGASWIVPRTCSLAAVTAYLETPGSAGNTVVDVNKNGTTILSAPISVAYDDADQRVTATPSVTALAEGDVLTVDIDSAATGAGGLVVQAKVVA